MSSSEVAQALSNFKKAAGDSFRNEPAPTLLTKFAVYKLFKNEWPQLFKRIYVQRQDLELVQAQINALRKCNRSQIADLPHDVVWAALRSIAIPDTIQNKTHGLLVNRRVVGKAVPHYAMHKATAEDLHPGLKSLPADGFLVIMGDSSTVDPLFMSETGRQLLSASTNTIMTEVLPRIERVSGENRAAKLDELCTLLTYSGIRSEQRLNNALIAAGLVKVERDDHDQPNKATLRAILNKKAGPHIEMVSLLDRKKLDQDGYDVNKIAIPLPDFNKLSKAEIGSLIGQLDEVRPMLRKYQKDLRGQQLTLIEEIKTLLKDRAALMDHLDQTFYKQNSNHDAAHHISLSLRNRSYLWLDDYKKTLESYIATLQEHQYVPEPLTKKPTGLVGWY